MFERLFFDPQARADAREGLSEMGRGIVWLIQWAAIAALGLIALGSLIFGLLIYKDWARPYESEIRWAIGAGLAAYGLWLLAAIKDLLAKILAVLISQSRLDRPDP